MADRPLGAQISTMLADRGVETIFGIPGVHNIELYRGLEQSGVRHVLARHEQGAGFMADGYARATGQMGVAYVISGPGLTNILTPMGQAYSDSVPLLVISSCLDEDAATMGQLHQMRDQEVAARTVCAWSETARTANAAYTLIDRAFADTAGARPRSMHMQVPINVLGTLAPPAPPAMDRLQRLSCVDAPVEDVVSYLRGAKRPLFIFGGGTQSLLCPGLMDRLGAASFVTYAGRGLIPEGDPLSFGSYLGRASSKDIIASADLVVAIGTELSENDLWRTELGHTAPLVRVDIDPIVLSDLHRADVQIQADSHDFMMALWNDTEGWTAKTIWSEAEVSDAKSRWKAETNADRPGIVPIADALRSVLPNDTMIFSDMTQFAYVSKEVWDMPAPGLWHHPSGFGTLGYALPAAIGGKIGVGDQPVVAIAGDYGFQYTIQELGTAAEEGICLPILLWDNEMLKEIEASMAASQIAPVAVQAKNPDFGKLAAAYEIDYTKPDTLESLQAAVTKALKSNGPTLIHMTPALSGTL